MVMSISTSADTIHVEDVTVCVCEGGAQISKNLMMFVDFVAFRSVPLLISSSALIRCVLVLTFVARPMKSTPISFLIDSEFRGRTLTNPRN